MRREKKVLWTDTAVFAVLLLAASAVMFWLFYRQAVIASPEGEYASDMGAYLLEIQGLDSGYSFPYPVFFKLAALISLFSTPELGAALTVTILNVSAMIIVKGFFHTFVLAGRENRLCDKIFISFLTVSLFFLSMLFPPRGIFYLPGIKFKYLGVFTGNPFHNATYLAARPFAILAFLSFGKLLPVYEKGYGREKDSPGLGAYVLFSVSLLIATMTKPSFTLVLVSTAGLVMLYRLIRNRFRTLLPTVQLGVCFVPTFLDLLYQFKGVFVPAEGVEGGIGVCFGEIWGYYCENMPLGIFLAMAFPLAVLVFNYKNLKADAWYKLAWQLYLVSFLEAFFLYEKGFRKPDFNFSWGYLYGIFFCHMTSLAVLVKATCGKTNKKCMLVLEWGLYLCHLTCGLFYLAGILAGESYY